MSLAAGTRIGPYEVIAALGEGGMGQVYRARDTKLNRIVAIKTLHDLAAGDSDRISRFDREAHLLASLNHPNIAAIYGVEDAQGSKFLVLEFVEGRTLASMIAHGALPIAECLTIAGQIADALVAAHDRGIIHRDLKPGNVMLTGDGQVKVLDFGLGKSLDAESSSMTSNSPTMTVAATQQGIILGTAGYMSPEQAKGRATDKRSDVWSFGCVLFEMLAGKRAFEGEDVTETIASIVRGEPDWTQLPEATPPQVRALVERCLIKDRARRLSDMSVVRFLLNEPPAPQTATTSVAPSGPARVAWPIVAGVGAVAVLATIGAMRLLPAPPPANSDRVAHLEITLPGDDQVSNPSQVPLAISPDGSMIVYSARQEQKDQLLLRRLSDRATTVLNGTSAAKTPFFSPEGRWVAFFAEGKLKKVTVGGTSLQVITDAAEARGGVWARDDTIYFAPTNTSGIWKVAASGGSPSVEVTKPDRDHGEISHRWPHVLPDGVNLLFTIWTGPGADERRIVRQSLATGKRDVLVPGGDTPRYVSPGFLVYGRFDAVLAVPWTPAQSSIGGAVPIAMPEFARLENEGGEAFAISDEGTFAYLAGGPERRALRVVYVDRSGHVEPLALPERDYRGLALSPDGTQLAVEIYDGTESIWLYDFARKTLTPFTSAEASSQSPVWTADGKHIFYRGTRNGSRNLYWKATDGTGQEERLTTKAEVVQAPESVSHDGRWLVYNEGGVSGQRSGIWKLPLVGDRTPVPVVRTNALTSNGRLSPDGRWLAFTSFASGREEVCVTAFPGPGPILQVSTTGATAAFWSRDSGELFFNAGDKLMAVSVASGPTFSAGPARLMHDGHFKTTYNSNTSSDISLDGQRFLRIQQTQPELPLDRIEIVLNWFVELKRAAAGK